MRSIVVRENEAKMIDVDGNIYIATKIKDMWIFQGRAYSSPFEAFKEVIK